MQLFACEVQYLMDDPLLLSLIQSVDNRINMTIKTWHAISNDRERKHSRRFIEAHEMQRRLKNKKISPSRKKFHCDKFSPNYEIFQHIPITKAFMNPIFDKISLNSSYFQLFIHFKLFA